jgi:hypothetical protein
MAAASPPPLELRLFAYVLKLRDPQGDPSFPIFIKGSQTVGELKIAILKESSNKLEGLNAQQLVLYKVDFADGEPESLEQLFSEATTTKEVLKVPSEELSELFPIQPPSKKVSIIVEAPSTSE